jgi:hypothetical protein
MVPEPNGWVILAGYIQKRGNYSEIMHSLSIISCILPSYFDDCSAPDIFIS